MFSAQNGIFLQIQKGVLSLFYASFQKKGRGGKLRQLSSEENRINNKKAEILWHDKDFGFFVPSFRYPKTKKADTAFAISALLSCFRMNLRSGKTYFRFAFRTSAILVIPSLILSSGMQE